MVWDPPGLDFEEFRGAFGRPLGALGRLFGVSCALWGASRMPLGLHGCFGLDFAWVWEGSWWDLARIWGGFCEGFGRPKWSKNRYFWYVFGYAFRDLNFGRILFDFG